MLPFHLKDLFDVSSCSNDEFFDAISNHVKPDMLACQPCKCFENIIPLALSFSVKHHWERVFPVCKYEVKTKHQSAANGVSLWQHKRNIPSLAFHAELSWLFWLLWQILVHFCVNIERWQSGCYNASTSAVLSARGQSVLESWVGGRWLRGPPAGSEICDVKKLLVVCEQGCSSFSDRPDWPFQTEICCDSGCRSVCCRAQLHRTRQDRPISAATSLHIHSQHSSSILIHLLLLWFAKMVRIWMKGFCMIKMRFKLA